jgi:hypothetical protein
MSEAAHSTVAEEDMVVSLTAMISRLVPSVGALEELDSKYPGYYYRHGAEYLRAEIERLSKLAEHYTGAGRTRQSSQNDNRPLTTGSRPR